MKVSTISYFIGGIGFVFIGLSIVFVSFMNSTSPGSADHSFAVVRV